jgi:hypothetical protein
MRELNIEWKHLDLNCVTCLRCSKTGKTLHQVIAELREELKPEGVEIHFVETKLSEKNIQHSNMVLIDEQPLEHILSGVKVAENYCSSCSCLTGDTTYCRTIQYNGETYEEIPEEIIRKAVFKILNLNK